MPPKIKVTAATANIMFIMKRLSENWCVVAMVRRFAGLKGRLDVFPACSVNDAAYSPSCYTVFLRQFTSNALFIDYRANFKHLRFCQFMCCTLFALISRSTITHFARRILHVIASCSDKQMLRINTRRIVTLVTNLQPFRDWSVMYHPGSPVCSPSAADTTITAYGGSPAIQTSCPQPAGRSLFDKFPKAFLQCHTLFRHCIEASCAAVFGIMPVNLAWIGVENASAV